MLGGVDGVIVPGGFGDRGIEGMISLHTGPASTRCPCSASASVCRWPLWRYARHVLGLADAPTPVSSSRTANPVIDLMPEQKDITDKGGTMRLGVSLQADPHRYPQL